MAEYRTDDDIYRVRLVWLGPDQYTLPVHLPFAEWGLFAVLAAACAVLTVLLSGGWGWAIPGAAAAMPLTAYICKHVNPDRPARSILRTIATDWRTLHPADEDRPLPRLTCRHIRWADTTEDHRG